MLKYIKNIALLIALGGVFAGLAAEQFRLLEQPESVYFNKTDTEKKDSSETKKFGEDDKFQVETFPYDSCDSPLCQVTRLCRNHTVNMPGSADYIAILTPPPERV